VTKENIPGKVEMLDAPELNQDVVRITEEILRQNAEIIKMNGRLLAVLSAASQFVVWREEG
jgi:hypothetical protein